MRNQGNGARGVNGYRGRRIRLLAALSEGISLDSPRTEDGAMQRGSEPMAKPARVFAVRISDRERRENAKESRVRLPSMLRNRCAAQTDKAFAQNDIRALPILLLSCHSGGRHEATMALGAAARSARDRLLHANAVSEISKDAVSKNDVSGQLGFTARGEADSPGREPGSAAGFHADRSTRGGVDHRVADSDPAPVAVQSSRTVETGGLPE